MTNYFDNADLLGTVDNYYSDKIKTHGATPLGVDWNRESEQTLRFEKISEVIRTPDATVLDIGCGYGAYYAYIQGHHSLKRYYGTDVSNDMIVAARDRFSKDDTASFACTSDVDRSVDYIVASGIFNVRFHYDDQTWEAYILNTIEKMNAFSNKGFSFNCLTAYSDRDKMRSNLYYADPLKLFDICKRKYSRNVSLLHDYELYEFTILVRKDG